MAFLLVVVPWDKILPIIKDILKDVINRYIRERMKVKEKLEGFVNSLFAGDPRLAFLGPLIYSCFSTLCDDLADLFKNQDFRTAQIVFLKVSWLFERFYGDTFADATWILAEKRGIEIPSKYEIGFDVSFSACWDVFCRYLDTLNSRFVEEYKTSIDVGGALIGSILRIMGISKIEIPTENRKVIINSSDLWILLPLLYYYIISSIETDKSVPRPLALFWLSLAPNFKEHIEVLIDGVDELVPNYYSQKTLRMFKEFGEYIYRYAEKLEKKLKS